MTDPAQTNDDWLPDYTPAKAGAAPPPVSVDGVMGRAQPAPARKPRAAPAQAAIPSPDSLPIAAEPAAPPHSTSTPAKAGASTGKDPTHPDDTAPPAPPRGGKPERPKGEIWDGCPVVPLGVKGKTQYLLDVHGQLREEIKLDIGTIASLFGNRQQLLWHRYPSYAKGAEKPSPMRFDQGKAQSDIISACADRGVFSKEGVERGAGAWTDDDGNLVYHAGDQVLIAGAWKPPGIHGGRIYSACAPIPRPAPVARADAAQKALALISTWCWRRPDLDPMLALGLTCAQMLGGALDWRPVGWWTGDAATGKTTLQKALLHLHGGEAGLLQATDATEGGIRSVIGQSSLPVSVDEVEPDKDNPQKVRAIIELARRAASGGVVFRGSADQKGHQSMARSAFVFSSILVPPMPAQDRSRLVLLELDRFPPETTAVKLDLRRLREGGAAIKRSLIDGWPTWAERLDRWRAALALNGLTGRSADNWGTVLAMADMALNAEIAATDVIEGWADKLARAVRAEVDEVGSNADDMLTHLLGQEFDVYRSGEKYIVAQWLMAAAGLPGAPPGIVNTGATGEDLRDQANRKLKKAGLTVEGKGIDGWLLIASSRLPELDKLFRDSQWAGGVWKQAARRLGGAEQRPTMSFAGQKSRATAIPLRAMPYLLGGPLEVPVTAPHPAGRSATDDMEDFA
jgi:hypothetical protein